MSAHNRLVAIEDGVLDILPAQEAPGVQLGICACIHGDEIVGWEVARWLCQEVALKRGRIRLVFGNITAFLAGQRRMDEDLNRVFTKELLQQEPPPHHEALRARRIVAALEGLERVIDLHSTSGPTDAAFLAAWDTEEALQFAQLFPILRTHGWRPHLKGTLIEYLADEMDIPAVAIEAGQHTQPQTIENAKAVVGTVLAKLEMIAPQDAPMAAGDFPTIRIIHNQVVKDRRSFRFAKEFKSFEPLAPGQPIAVDGGEELRAPQREGVRIIMPTRLEAIRSGQCKEAYFLGVEE